jgi:hypothetical protein
MGQLGAGLVPSVHFVALGTTQRFAIRHWLFAKGEERMANGDSS